MLYDLKIKLSSPFLGDQRTNEGIRRFKRSKSNELEIQVMQWQWALKEATSALHLEHILVENIRFTEFQVPALVLYNRRWKEHGKQREEMFEAIKEGTVLTIPFYVPANPDVDLAEDTKRNKTVPGELDLKVLFEFIGEVLGLSPWGSKFGYGRFTVLGITAK